MKPNKTENTEPGIEPISKTKRKAEADAQQAIGVTLVGLPKDKLAKLELPETLLDAVNEAKRINSNGALRRQMQYLGRLMRDIDTAPIVDQLQRWEGSHNEENARFHRLEQWRSRLLEDESALAEFINEHPNTEAQQIRNLIRNARREHAAGKPPKSSRELFKLIRGITENITPETELDAD
ncbi:ribosome biogenesis factor YjgA [Methylobacillus methanolivorans]